MDDDHPTPSRPDVDLTDEELDALHNLQLAVEHVYQAYGDLLRFHHEIGHAMDQMNDAETALREAGHEAWANRLRDHLLPSGAIDDAWTYELVDAFRDGLLADATDLESDVREDLADGVDHVTERRQQARWRERAGWDE
ncbi:hypothetical protein [Halogeometricum limi]|uniref:Uncharacterized protein n=1 Tax=Halogeometricum limi TaxID=555875 RepID=A0A1I6H5D6_9EURY|nr:hypothetical protein [Halogeometricum limi]SFR49632.1 hypothetical protein SAMN04488124_1788 [Halogeometricum limi]